MVHKTSPSDISRSTRVEGSHSAEPQQLKFDRSSQVHPDLLDLGAPQLPKRLDVLTSVALGGGNVLRYNHNDDAFDVAQSAGDTTLSNATRALAQLTRNDTVDNLDRMSHAPSLQQLQDNVGVLHGIYAKDKPDSGFAGAFSALKELKRTFAGLGMPATADYIGPIEYTDALLTVAKGLKPLTEKLEKRIAELSAEEKTSRQRPAEAQSKLSEAKLKAANGLLEELRALQKEWAHVESLQASGAAKSAIAKASGNYFAHFNRVESRIKKEFETSGAIKTLLGKQNMARHQAVPNYIQILTHLIEQ